MPAASKQQQKFMGIVRAIQKGDVPASKFSKAAQKAAKSMDKKSVKKYAATKHDDLPKKVKKKESVFAIKGKDIGKGYKIATEPDFIYDPEKKMKKESINEDGHTDVASAERKLKLIIKDAMDTLNALRSLSNEDSLPSWWTDKITLAKDYVGKSRDYIMNPAESVNEKTISIGGEDLMKYLMKRFKMSKSQAIASMKKHKMDMSFLKKESVNEAVEPRGNIKKVLDVAKNKQAKKIGGTLVDGTTANMMTQVWNKVNDSSKEKMNKMNTKQLINLILRLWKTIGTPRV